ncbi:glycosyltransferase [Psychromonas sp. PT13]|uniref:glycosyltransferase n=1 Tax=Psychromonas sp. PT13 TaxID=3439547 RepID=UPI003EBAF06F
MLMIYKYSIIVPHFNDFDNLKKLLSSIPKRDDIEIIIVDDNSDSILDLSAFINHNVSLFINDKGVQSAGACRNIGLKHATAKWLLFADSDDFFTSSAFDILDENAREDFDVIYFSPTSVDLKTGLISTRHIHYQKLVKYFLRNGGEEINFSFYASWSRLISNVFLKNNSIQFDEVIASNDVMFSLEVALRVEKINASDEAIYCITKRKGSLTTLVEPKILKTRYKVSMHRNDLLYQCGQIYYQEPFLRILKRYWRIINLKTIITLFKLLLMGRLLFFPTRFKASLKNLLLLEKKRYKK